MAAFVFLFAGGVVAMAIAWRFGIFALQWRLGGLAFSEKSMFETPSL
jgi:hypothetical protein